jgi:rhamnosyltransferase
MVDALLRAAAEDPTRLSLCPLITAPNGRKPESAGGVVAYAITSGNLLSLRVFDDVGPFNEEFFIDCIDFDFCLRLRRAGHFVYRVGQASMQHALGEEARVPSPFRRFYARHPPARRYYMTRNYLYLAERHLLDFPGFVLKLGISQLILGVLVAFLDLHPLASYRAMGRGVLDYLAHRTGERVGSAT